MTFVILRYIVWHYSRAFEDIVRIGLNFLWFVYHYFSIPNLVKTLFSPWERLHEKYLSVFRFEDWLGALATNTIMRIVGAITRIFTIILGFICIALLFFLEIFFIVVWPLIPVFILGLIVKGIFLVIF